MQREQELESCCKLWWEEPVMHIKFHENRGSFSPIFNAKKTKIDNRWRRNGNGMQRRNGKGTRDENLGGTSLRADECVSEIW